MTVTVGLVSKAFRKIEGNLRDDNHRLALHVDWFSLSLTCFQGHGWSPKGQDESCICFVCNSFWASWVQTLHICYYPRCSKLSKALPTKSILRGSGGAREGGGGGQELTLVRTWWSLNTVHMSLRTVMNPRSGWHLHNNDDNTQHLHSLSATRLAQSTSHFKTGMDIRISTWNMQTPDDPTPTAKCRQTCTHPGTITAVKTCSAAIHGSWTRVLIANQIQRAS